MLLLMQRVAEIAPVPATVLVAQGLGRLESMAPEPRSVYYEVRGCSDGDQRGQGRDLDARSTWSTLAWWYLNVFFVFFLQGGGTIPTLMPAVSY